MGRDEIWRGTHRCPDLCPNFRAETAPRQSCVSLPAALWPPKLTLAATALPPILPSAELIFAATAAAAKVTLAAEAQPAKLRKVGGYHLGANDEHAAVLTPPKLRTIGGRRAGRQNSPHFSGFAAADAAKGS